MCTALSYTAENHYFGRTLDLEYAYCESVTITPRNYPLEFRHVPAMPTHYAMIGMAYVNQGYPLYYEATNDVGLSMAGLRFADHAYYGTPIAGKDAIASFELIPWILGQCATVAQAKQKLERMCLVNDGFSAELPPTPMHWMIADKTHCIVVESVREGLMVYDNPVGILTNNPPFVMQLHALSNYMNLSPKWAENRFSPNLNLEAYSLGMGAMGLPGDFSSQSRFVKGAFVKENSVPTTENGAGISQFFHIMDSIAQVRGCVETRRGELEFTRYTSCCDTEAGIYYYTTYENRSITGVSIHGISEMERQLVSYPIRTVQVITMEN